jgi:hypothetical protein
MSAIIHRVITIRGLLRDVNVAALCIGDWGVHRQLDNPSLFAITLLPLGHSLPYTWASFKNPQAAISAMRMIARLRNSWSRVTREDFTRELKDQLQAICLRHGAVEGPAQWALNCDKNLLGLPTKERVNGYRHPGGGV